MHEPAIACETFDASIQHCIAATLQACRGGLLYGIDASTVSLIFRSSAHQKNLGKRLIRGRFFL
jgi:hypothetical protein